MRAYAGGDLELSEIALYSGASRIDGAATLSCSHAPISGALADLKDGSTSTVCRFAAEDARSPGFFLQWDFGSAVDVTEIKLGAGPSAARWMAAATLVQGASIGVWSYVADFSGAVYPGSGVLTTSSGGGVVPTTWNPADKGSACVLSNGNLTGSAPSVNGSVRSIFSASAGKWYWEVTSSTTYPPGIGAGRVTASLAGYVGIDANGWAWYGDIGQKYNAGSGVAYGGAGSIAGVVIGIALNMDAGTITLYKGGVSLGVMYSGLTGAIYAMCGGNASTASNFTANFGGAAFAGALPAGHVAGFGPTALALPLVAPPLVRTLRRGQVTAASAVVGGHRVPAVLCASMARDIEHGGPGTIYGTTKTKGTPNAPTKARVVLQHQRSKLPVRETWSDPVTGYFAFTGIDTNQQFLTLAEDAAGNFRPVAANRLTPEVP